METKNRCTLSNYAIAKLHRIFAPKSPQEREQMTYIIEKIQQYLPYNVASAFVDWVSEKFNFGHCCYTDLSNGFVEIDEFDLLTNQVNVHDLHNLLAPYQYSACQDIDASGQVCCPHVWKNVQKDTTMNQDKTTCDEGYCEYATTVINGVAFIAVNTFKESIDFLPDCMEPIRVGKFPFVVLREEKGRHPVTVYCNKSFPISICWK